jgi:hypothetical protein
VQIIVSSQDAEGQIWSVRNDGTHLTPLASLINKPAGLAMGCLFLESPLAIPFKVAAYDFSQSIQNVVKDVLDVLTPGATYDWTPYTVSVCMSLCVEAGCRVVLSPSIRLRFSSSRPPCCSHLRPPLSFVSVPSCPLCPQSVDVTPDQVVSCPVALVDYVDFVTGFFGAFVRVAYPHRCCASILFSALPP